MKRLFVCIAAVVLMAGLHEGRLIAQEILTLDDCLNIGRMRATTVVNAGYQRSSAQAGKKLAYANILPDLSGSISSRHSVVGPTIRNEQVVQGVVIGGGTREGATSNSHSFNTTLSQTIYDGGAWWNQIRQSKEQIEAADLDYEAALIDVGMQVKNAYYTLLKEKKQLTVLQESQVLREEQLRRSETMFRVGSVAQIDVFRSRVELNQVKIQILSQHAAIENAKASLNVAMGRDQATPVDVVETEPQVRELAISLQQALAIARSGHPEIMASEHDVQAQEYAVKVSKAGWLPSITARAGYGRNHSDLTRVYREYDKNYNWYLNGNINFNIFDGRRTSGQVQRSQAQEDIARQNLKRTMQNIELDIAQAYNNYTTNLEKVALYEDNLVEAEETLRLAEGRYQQGAGTLLEIIDAQSTLTSAQIQLVRAQFDSDIFRSRLEAAIGNNTQSTMLYK